MKTAGSAETVKKLRYLESGCDLRDESDDLAVLDVVISVLHQISPKDLTKRNTCPCIAILLPLKIHKLSGSLLQQ